jgi:hypothetical protein
MGRSPKKAKSKMIRLEEHNAEPSFHGFGPNLLEKLLMAIIQKHPTRSKGVPKSHLKRLNNALSMLIGKTSKHHIFPGELNYKYERAVLWMVEEEFRLKLDRENRIARAKRRGIASKGDLKAASKKNLADQARRLFFPDSEVVSHTISKRLSEMLTGVYEKKQKARKFAASKFNQYETYKYRALHHDNVAESLEAQALKKIANLLEGHVELNLAPYE